jgi:hypothetical protein
VQVLHMELVQVLHMELVLELRNRSLVLVRSSSCSSICSSIHEVCGLGEALVGNQVLARSMLVLVLVLRSKPVLAHNNRSSYRTNQPKRSRTRKRQQQQRSK